MTFSLSLTHFLVQIFSNLKFQVSFSFVILNYTTYSFWVGLLRILSHLLLFFFFSSTYGCFYVF